MNSRLMLFAYISTFLTFSCQNAVADDRAWLEPTEFVSLQLLADSASGPVPSHSANTAGSALIIQVGTTPEISSDSDTWVLVAPYLWAPAMKGTVGARGVTAPVDLTLGELIELIPDLNGAFMGHVEVGRGSTGLIFDGLLMQLSPSGRGPGGGKVSVDTGSTILETLGMVRVVDLQAEADSGFVLDLLGGARYYQVQNQVRIDPLIGPTLQADLTKDWVDLVVGARSAVTLMPGLQGFVRGDIGGFGIGTSSSFAWNVTTGVEYAYPTLPGSSVILGYRVLDIDETQKTGANQFVYDVTMHGPFSAFAYRF